MTTAGPVSVGSDTSQEVILGPRKLHFEVTVEPLDAAEEPGAGTFRPVDEAVQMAATLAAERAGLRITEIAFWA